MWSPLDRYDDKTKEDFDVGELLKYALRYDDGEVIGVSKKRKDTSPVPDDCDTPDSSTRQKTYDVPCYVTKENDTFHKICSNAGIADGKRRGYLEWLEERHNIGRRRSDGANRELLIKDPFITKTRHTRFQAGCNIPLPAGESWNDKLREKNIGADLQNEEHMNSYIAETYCAMACQEQRLKTRCRRGSTKAQGKAITHYACCVSPSLSSLSASSPLTVASTYLLVPGSWVNNVYRENY